MAAEDVKKTAITTPFGLFEYRRMSFGLRNAAQTFQRFMEEVTRGLEFCFVYIDGVLIASDNKVQHQQHLRILFERFRTYGIVINVAKSELGQTKIKFLGESCGVLQFHFLFDRDN